VKLTLASHSAVTRASGLLGLAALREAAKPNETFQNLNAQTSEYTTFISEVINSYSEFKLIRESRSSVQTLSKIDL
jgi:hypothetical protein